MSSQHDDERGDEPSRDDASGAGASIRLRTVAASPQARVIRLGVVCAVLAVAALFVFTDIHATPYPIGAWTFPAVIVGVIAAEPMVFHIESRNEAISFSPSDIPLAVGILTLSPLAVVVARVVGAAAGLAVFRRQPPFKFILNLCSFAVEAAIAAIVFQHLNGAATEVTFVTWPALMLAGLTGLVASGMIITRAISYFEGDFVDRASKEIRHIYLYYLPGAVLGASAAVAVPIATWLGLVFLVPAPMVWLVLRSHGALMHRYSDLSDIHEFSSELSRSSDLEELATVAAREIAANLRAESVGICVWDDEGRATRVTHGSSALADALHRLPDTLSGRRTDDQWRLLTATDEQPEAREWLEAAGLREAIVIALADGERRIGHLVVADRTGASASFTADDHARLRPLTNQLAVALRKSQLHLQIQHDASHDRLTGIANRAYFEAWLDQVANDTSTSHALLLMDLDRFKEVNDTLGHHAGDQLLIEVATRISGCLSSEDVPSRLGGDEFAIFLHEASADDACAVAERISAQLELPFELAAGTVAIAASIGIALAPAHGTDRDALLHRADLAMYHAKRNHRRLTLFHDELEGDDSERLRLLADLRIMLERGDLDLHFQPQVDLSTGEVRAAEALARWTHPVRGRVPPELFVAVAEQAGLIGELTFQVLDQALAAVRRWSDSGHDLSVAVNLSAISLVSDDLVTRLAERLERAGIEPTQLTIEITESTMIGDTPRTRRTLEELAALGVRLSVDDFGTGYSSLTSLRHLPFTELKIDRSFVTRMVVEPNDEVIVRSTIALGHELGLDVVAEGVETRAALRGVVDAGCTIGQGYEICPPLPPEEFDRWLAQRQRVDGATASAEAATPVSG